MRRPEGQEAPGGKPSRRVRAQGQNSKQAEDGAKLRPVKGRAGDAEEGGEESTRRRRKEMEMKVCE